MIGKIPKSLYWPFTPETVAIELRSNQIPAPFTHRMRILNLISQSILRHLDAKLFLPYDVSDLSHILDKQINQDSIIAHMASEALKTTLLTGDISPLVEIVAANRQLKYGIDTGWIAFAFEQPFEPLNIMLAMRSKLLFDLIDELGHSFNLYRALSGGLINDPPPPPDNGEPPPPDNG
ncbi:hypothetical protein LCGC14_2888080, partial [marine sediment metagenome]